MNKDLSHSKSKVSFREILAWCFYDFANSCYPTIILTAFYVLYFKEVVIPGNPRADFLWGLGISISMFLVAVSSPVLGAIADLSGAKKRFLIWYCCISVVCTGLLATTGFGTLIWALFLLIFSCVGFEGGNVFYNAFLPQLAGPYRIGKISGYGWALGYLGGLSCLFLILPLVRGGFGEENLLRCRLALVITALWFFIFSLPIFIFVRERANSVKLGARDYIRLGFRRFISTLQNIRAYRDLSWFYLSYFFFNDGIVTVIAFSGNFAKTTLNFSVSEILVLIGVVNVTAALGAFLFGFMVDKKGAKKTVLITLLIWMAVVFWVYFVRTKGEFWLVTFVASVAIGATQSASRCMVGLFAPSSKKTEFFGFMAVCGKFSAILGPLCFGLVSSIFKSQRPAVLSLGVFFLIGFIILFRVNEKRGKSIAQKEV